MDRKDPGLLSLPTQIVPELGDNLQLSITKVFSTLTFVLVSPVRLRYCTNKTCRSLFSTGRRLHDVLEYKDCKPSTFCRTFELNSSLKEIFLFFVQFRVVDIVRSC